MTTPHSQTANRLGGAFYTVTALVALAGATTAATQWLGWALLPAALAVAVIELGAIALTARADLRRRLGERATAARALSVGVAGFAVAFQWLGHADHRQGLFFAGTSALAYATWLVNSADRRRDALRADSKLPPTPPVYGLVQWVRHPWLTRRARHLALQDPTLGLYGSLAAATAQKRAELRQAALAGLLRRKLAQGRDKLAAEIAVTTYDLDEIAARLAAAADYDGLTALIAAELHPARLAGDGGATPQAMQPANPPTAAFPGPDVPPTQPRREPAGGAADDVPDPAVTAGQRVRQDRRTTEDVTATILALAATNPTWSARRIGAAVGRSEATVRRVLGPAGAAPVSSPPAGGAQSDGASRELVTQP